MSFLKSLFGSKTSKKLKRTYDKAGLSQIYEEAKELFLRGKYDQALDSFKSVYEHDATLHDVASIIEDYYVISTDKWIAKYETQFRAQLPKESGDDAGTSSDEAGTGSAPVPAPKRPVTPSGSFGAERHPDEDGRAA